MASNSITLDFKTKPTVTVDGKTHTFKKGEKEGEFKPIDENVGGVTYSLVKDAKSGYYKMTITGEPDALEKYNFGVSKGRVTKAKFEGSDSMENFFKGDSQVGDKNKATKYFQSFSIGGAHLADRAAFLQSGAWGLDKTSAKKELERLEEEAKKAKEAEGSKKNSGTQEAGEQMPVVKKEGPQQDVSDPVNSSSVATSQKTEEPAQSKPPVVLKKQEIESLGPKVANLQGNADRFGEVLTDIYETFDQARDSKADKHTTQQITDACNNLFKNFGIIDNDGNLSPGLEDKHLDAIITWGEVQAERRISEKNGTPISPERETQLQEKEAKAYEAFEEALSRYPAQRQAVLQAGAEIRQNIAKGINLPEKEYGFGNNIPQLQQKPAEVLEKLLSTRKLGDDYFEFDAS
jgi:hypothetical protein